MKISLLAAALFAAFVPIRAQEPAASGSSAPLETPSLLPNQSLFPSIPAPSESVPATPPSTNSKAETAPSPAATPETLKKGTAEQLRQAIQLRELKTQILGTTELQALKAKAQCAKTEEARRILMRNYYTRLYSQIEQLDPSLHELVEKEWHDQLYRFEQHKVCPSVLIEPVTALPGSCSTDHAAPSPSPSPTPKKPSSTP